MKGSKKIIALSVALVNLFSVVAAACGDPSDSTSSVGSSSEYSGVYSDDSSRLDSSFEDGDSSGLTSSFGGDGSDSSSNSFDNGGFDNSSSSFDDSSVDDFPVDDSSLTASSTNDSSGDFSSDDEPVITQKYDPETRALVLASEALNQNFNPFFVTSSADKKIVDVTQIKLLTYDENGSLICGEDQATAALDYSISYVDESGAYTYDPYGAVYTDYSFIIKNGVKFSDGVPLTIDDILFNLYVYLDPLYTGPCALSSVDIVGLRTYQAQDATWEGATNSQLQALFKTNALTRIQNIIDYCEEPGDYVLTEQMKTDMACVDGLFLEEITADWDRFQGTLEEYEQELPFTEDWQAYLFNEGLVRIVTVQGEPVKDNDGKYVTNLNNLDEDGDGNYEVNMDEPVNEYMHEVLSEDNIAAYMTEKGCDEMTAKNELAKEAAIFWVYNGWVDLDNFYGYDDVLLYWETGVAAIEEFTRQEKLEYYAMFETDQLIESVYGITTAKTMKDFNGDALGEEHDVLTIRVYGLDISAAYHFDFSVAPMHYYSDEATIKTTPYGVAFANQEFFEDVLNTQDKNGLPVGAGPYKASSQIGDAVDRYGFCKNNWVYLERNEYFETVGTELSNAKIKYLRYKVMDSDKVLQCLESGEIDCGEVTPTISNLNAVSEIEYLKWTTHYTDSYAYVGISAKHVPDLEVRHAIMKALDPGSAIDVYYGGVEGLAEPIYRPISKMSWAYPGGSTRYDEVEFTTDKHVILKLVKQAGWVMEADGRLYKYGEPLKLVFTIAGTTEDHPAYTMFKKAAEFLNECGFVVTVVTDANAAAKLATGELQVWTGVWEGSGDPGVDMYAKYHKDSLNWIVNAWGYDAIFNYAAGYEREKPMIEDLSLLIEEARKATTQEQAKEIYEELLDKVMALGVEFPVYQCGVMCTFNKNVIDVSTTNQDPTPYSGVMDRIWEINYN